TDASAIDLQGLRREAGLVARLLSIGLPLTVVVGTLLAAGLFPELPLGVALLVGATLAPTDAALGQPVVTNPVVPVRIRRLLNAESGLNDGIATPIVVLALALIGSEGTGHGDWLATVLREGLLGTLIGVAAGTFGGWLLLVADRAAWTSRSSRQLAVLALALAAYFGAIALGGNGFIAAFVAGLAFGGATQHVEMRAEVFSEAAGSLLSIVVWMLAGGFFVSAIGASPDARPIVYALLSLTVVRMAPVALALVGSGLRRDTILFVGWFGPRGLASIVFALLGLEAMRASQLPVDLVAATIAWTILLSVVLHGLSGEPLARWYGGRIAGVGAGLPEHEEMPEPRRKVGLDLAPPAARPS
ncbi:MAG: cation:proton antiporter, partial [Candidatus Limnocylindrales bacterium]